MDCLEKNSPLAALKHGCYRGSRAATVPLALSILLHRRLGTWHKHVNGFIVLSDYQRRLVIGAGLPADKIYVKPNFFKGNVRPRPWSEREAKVVFVGRVSPEKGIETLIKAWLLWGSQAPELRVVGDGPFLKDALRMANQATSSRIHFTQRVPLGTARLELASAKLVVVPSLCYEGFPMVVAEALAMGTPIAVSDIEPLSSIVKAGEIGTHFMPGDPESLLATVKELWGSQDRLSLLSVGARKEFEAKYTEEVNYQALMDVYERVLAATGMDIAKIER